jgi:MraZ protein
MGIDKCLYVFTQDSWADYRSKYISNRSLTDINARKLQRLTVGHAHELEIDRQGRINLPQFLIEYAKIDKDVVFLGCEDRIEVWSAAAYEKDMAEDLDLDKLMRNAAEAAGEE